MLENLTILITTYNRYCFLERLLTFYQSFKTDAKILILDSSSEKIYSKDLISKLEQKNITWKKYNSKIFVANKIKDGCKYISTDFAVLCADDDFLIPNSLKKAVKFLQKNNNYSSCLGIQIKHHYFSMLNRKIVIFNKSTKMKNHFNSDQILNRISKYLSGTSNYYPFYAVHRANDLKKIWKITANNTNFWGLVEILPCCLSLVIGKMKILNIVYTSRQKNTFNWHNREVLEKMYSSKKINRAVNSLSNFIINYDNNYNSNNTKIILNKNFRILKQRLLNRRKYNLYNQKLFIQKIKMILTSIPFIGNFIIDLISKLNSKFRLYFIDRISLKKCLGRKTAFLFLKVFKNINCDNKIIENSRKNYSRSS